MLTVTPQGARLRGFEALGAATAVIKILGVPFPFKQITFGIWIPADRNAVTVPKSKVPKALALAIDILLSKVAHDLLAGNPPLAANPVELLAQTKAKSKIVVVPGQAVILNPLKGALLGKTISPTDGKNLDPQYIVATDVGSSYQVRLVDVPSGGFHIPIVSDLLESVTKLVAKLPGEAIDLVKNGLEAALKIIGNFIKGLCAIAQSDAAKLTQSITSANLDISANLKASGADAKMTAAASSAAAAAAAAKADPRVAAATAGLKVLQGMCGGPAAPGGGTPAVAAVPWWKRPSTYVAGAGALAVGTISVLAVRKARR